MFVNPFRATTLKFKSRRVIRRVVRSHEIYKFQLNKLVRELEVAPTARSTSTPPTSCGYAGRPGGRGLVWWLKGDWGWVCF